jgi:hypothetical protein
MLSQSLYFWNLVRKILSLLIYDKAGLWNFFYPLPKANSDLKNIRLLLVLLHLKKLIDSRLLLFKILFGQNRPTLYVIVLMITLFKLNKFALQYSISVNDCVALSGKKYFLFYLLILIFYQCQVCHCPSNPYPGEEGFYVLCPEQKLTLLTLLFKPSFLR